LANHKSAEKRARQSVKRNTRNNNVQSAVRTFEKNLHKAIDAKSKDVAEHLKAYTSRIMSAVTKGVVKKETAARKISRLSARVSAVTK
jgi:small subunit ribosomal protein S20